MINATNVLSMATRKPLSRADQEAAANLRRIWDQRQRERSFTQESAAHEMGWKTQGAVNQYLLGKIPLNLKAILKFAQYLDVHPSAIRGDMATILAPATRIEDSRPSYGNLAPAPIATRRVPLISWVQAGNWCPVADPYPPGAAESYVGVDIRVSDAAFALTVRGDSMLNPNTGEGFPEGCIIVVDPGEAPRHGHYVVVRLEDSDEATFKQLVTDGPKRYLRPINPRYPIIEINGNASICGVVKKMIIERNF